MKSVVVLPSVNVVDVEILKYATSKETYAYELAQALEAMFGWKLAIVQGAIRDLRRYGLLHVTERRVGTEGGPLRAYLTVTPLGREMLRVAESVALTPTQNA